MSEQHIPLLYSFRRCPYAMRARMGLYYAQISLDIFEVDLKNRPQALYDLSPKGTVPVLYLPDGTIIDESLDIARWALAQHDPDGWLDMPPIGQELMTHNDKTFKGQLDRYKYPTRFPNEDCSTARENALVFLERLESCLNDSRYLCADHLTLCDVAIFPFIRQFAHVDKGWFDALDLPQLHPWFHERLESDLFTTIMDKRMQSMHL